MPTSEFIIDTQTQGTNYLLEVTVGSTPTVKVYIYANGSPISIAATETVKLVYAPSRESSSVTELTGVAGAGLAYVTFTFTAASLPTSGKFWSSIILIDESASTNVVQSDGVLIVKKNPITG